MAVKVTTRTYDPVTRLIIDDQSDMLSFGAIAPGSKSRIVVLDSVITGVVSAGELGIGIADSNLPEGSLPGLLYYAILDSLDSIVEPTTLFPGIAGTEGSSNVVDVGFRSPLVSKYVVMMMKSADMPLACGCIILKWFFGFDKKA